jgi:hypothetical protein
VPSRAIFPYKGTTDAGPEGMCARRESNPQHPPPQDGLSASWSTSTWSRYPVPTRVVRGTKAEPQPCASAELGNQGSNLDSSGPEPDVLPDYTIPH